MSGRRFSQRRPASAPATAAFGTGVLREVSEVYAGSDGEATRALYARLEAFGPIGVIAVNVFRAQKCSERAKRYRGSQFKSAAYERKDWSIGNLANALQAHAEAAGISWGWAIDDKQEGPHSHLLYIDLPTGQVSWHGGRRYGGPDYDGAWDGKTGLAPERICRWIADLLEASRAGRAA